MKATLLLLTLTALLAAAGCATNVHRVRDEPPGGVDHGEHPGDLDHGDTMQK